MIVSKAVKMADMMDIPILGIVENMSYLQCPDCKKKIKVFGERHIEKISYDFRIKTIAKLPFNPDFADLCDKGMVEMYEGDYLNNIVHVIEKME